MLERSDVMPAVLIAYFSLLGCWTISEILILLLTRTPQSSGTVRDRGSLRILWPAIVGGVSFGTWYGDTHTRNILHGSLWVRLAALVLFVAGLTIRWAAIWSLGRSFSANVAIHATQQLHRNGLFRFVRHPSYTGLLLVLLAIGVFTRNWLGLAMVFLPGVFALLYRIRVEEAALRQAFGQQYDEYTAATKRLLPGLY
jgi:protein-S-isoprenylcysteine O-methyltransferase Ste14